MMYRYDSAYMIAKHVWLCKMDQGLKTVWKQSLYNKAQEKSHFGDWIILGENSGYFTELKKDLNWTGIFFSKVTSGQPVLRTECLRGRPFPPHQQRW